MGCRLWGRTESDTTEAAQQQQQQLLLESEEKLKSLLLSYQFPSHGENERSFSFFSCDYPYVFP